MRWVPTAAAEPHRCAVIPFVGANDPQGFLDTGNVMRGFDQHVYVSVKAVVHMAQAIGLPGADAHSQALLRAEAAEEALAVAQERIADLQAQVDAVGVLKKADWKNPGGRPPKKVAA